MYSTNARTHALMHAPTHVRTHDVISLRLICICVPRGLSLYMLFIQYMTRHVFIDKRSVILNSARLGGS